MDTALIYSDIATAAFPINLKIEMRNTRRAVRK
jgi:hypothetical protein